MSCTASTSGAPARATLAGAWRAPVGLARSARRRARRDAAGRVGDGARRATPPSQVIDELAGLLAPGDVHRRRRQLELPRRQAPWRRAGRARHRVRRRRHVRRRLGLDVGYCLMVGGIGRPHRAPCARARHARPAGRLAPRRPRRRRALRQDGAQRHRVRAACRPTPRASRSCARASSSSTWRRSPSCGAAASVVRSWLLELLANALARGPGLEGIKGYVEDSGEGRWTIMESISESVPAPVIYAQPRARFSARARTESTRPRSSRRCATSSAATP